METMQFAVGRAGAFGEDYDRVSLVSFPLQVAYPRVVSVAGIVEAEVAYDMAEDRRVIHPFVGNHDDAGRERKHQQDVDKRGVVGYDDGRAVEGVGIYPFIDFLSCIAVHDTPAQLVGAPRQRILFAPPGDGQGQHDDEQQREQETAYEKLYEKECRAYDTPQRVGRQFLGCRVAYEQVEDDRFYGVCYKYHGHHAYDGDQRERLQGGVQGKDHGPHTYHGGECREEYGRLVRVEQLVAAHVAVLQAIHDEDAEIVADTEDECREDDVDDVEADVEQPHYSHDDNPADAHGQEADECQLDTAV